MRRRWRTVILVTGTTLCVLVAMTGCGAFQLPKPLMRSERAQLKNAHINLTVGVIREGRPPYPTAVALRAFKRLKLFDRIDYLDVYVGEIPDLVADFDYKLGTSTVIPIVTMLTFGLVPYIDVDRFGQAVTFTPALDGDRSREGGRSVRVEFSYESTYILGWLAAPVPILPGWGTKTPRYHRRMYERLALAIIAQADEISAVAVDR